jgi:Putative cyclase
MKSAFDRAKRRKPVAINVSRAAVYEAADKLSNWGRWGGDDQIGTLNYVKPEDIVRAASLVQQGKIFALGIPLDRTGPQTGLFGGRWNPIHTMLATGTDAVAGRQDKTVRLRYADDAINMPVQGATHWDALGHIFLDDKMYNGYDARMVDSNGLGKLGIEHSRDKMVGRGVLLDIARYKGIEYLPDGYGISNDDLDATAKLQNVEIRSGDFVIFRTGQMERCHKKKNGVVMLAATLLD